MSDLAQRTQTSALRGVAEIGVFVGLGPFFGSVFSFLIGGILNGNLLNNLDPDSLSFYVIFVFLAYLSTWRAALLAGVVVAVARNFGLRGYLLLIFAAVTGIVSSMLLSPAGAAIGTEPRGIAVGVSVALAAVVCAWVVGKMHAGMQI